MHDDFRKWCFYDDKSLEIPPPPPSIYNAPQYRFPTSKKQQKYYAKRKSTLKIQMGVAISYDGKSNPVFNVVKEKIKKRSKKSSGKKYRQKIISITSDIIIDRIRSMIVPFMEESGANILVLDNAPVQACKKVIRYLNSNNIENIGF